MLSAYDNYKLAHEALFTSENEEQMLINAKATVDNYLENRLIWDELNHYKQHHEILAKHPIFEEKQEILKICDNVNRHSHIIKVCQCHKFRDMIQ